VEKGKDNQRLMKKYFCATVTNDRCVKQQGDEVARLFNNQPCLGNVHRNAAAHAAVPVADDSGYLTLLVNKMPMIKGSR
jgi:hypothetical protein